TPLAMPGDETNVSASRTRWPACAPAAKRAGWASRTQPSAVRPSAAQRTGARGGASTSSRSPPLARRAPWICSSGDVVGWMTGHAEDVAARHVEDVEGQPELDGDRGGDEHVAPGARRARPRERDDDGRDGTGGEQEVARAQPRDADVPDGLREQVVHRGQDRPE